METIIRAPVLSDERRTLPRRYALANGALPSLTPAPLHKGAQGRPSAALSGAPATAAPATAAPQTAASPTAASLLAASPVAPPEAIAADDSASIRAHRQLADAELASAFVLAENRGFESGLAKGEAAGMAALQLQAARLAAVAAALCEARAEVRADAQDMLVEIVHAATAKILGESILSREGIAGAVECTMRSFRDDEQLVVRLHPQDAQLLLQAWRGADKPSPMQATVREDPSIVLGGCIVDSARGSLDARLDTQLAALRETLLAVRRQHGGIGGAI
jgi:flagellar assembly protein FliH